MTTFLDERVHTSRRRRPPRKSQEKITRQSTGQGRLEYALDTRLLAKALTIRRTEERLLSLFAEGKVFGTVHTCIGQEWVGVAVADALRQGDYVVSNHRGHGHYLAWTDDVEGLIAEIMGRKIGVCGGRGGSQHLCKDGFFSNGIQGGMVPVAAGLATAHQMIADDGIATVFIGDGTLGQGAVYETLNMAAKWSLPLLIVIEDNGIAQSTPTDDTLAGSIKGRAAAFGLRTIKADTWHPEQLIERAKQAADLVRQDKQPALLHVKTYRLKAHSKGDDDRNPNVVAEFAASDTLNKILSEDNKEIEELVAAIDRRIDRAVQKSEEAAYTDVTAPACTTRPAVLNEWEYLEFQPTRVADGIRRALAEAMNDDPRMVLLGEDLRDPYGGAFKVTAGLSRSFDRRVRNTPISEAGIVGVANGLALAGMRPMVEIMFGDFVTLAADQFINHAAKFAWMYNDKVNVPLVIRTPMGGYRGYGPTHSQCLEKHLLGLPGTRVLALHRRYSPWKLYRELLADNDRPTLVIENKMLYTQQADAEAPADFALSVNQALFPTVRLSPTEDTPTVTLVAYGAMVGLAEAAAVHLWEQEEIACEVIMPTQLYPLDVEPILESVNATGKVVIVEEGQSFAGWGSELLAQLGQDDRTGRFQARRIGPASHPLPACKPAEADALPDVEQIIDTIKALFL